MEWWGEMKDVYSLKNEEVIPLLDEYNTYLWELVDKIKSKEDINESYRKRSWQNDSFINKVSDDIMRETKKSNEFPHLFMFPFINKPIVFKILGIYLFMCLILLIIVYRYMGSIGILK